MIGGAGRVEGSLPVVYCGGVALAKERSAEFVSAISPQMNVSSKPERPLTATSLAASGPASLAMSGTMAARSVGSLCQKAEGDHGMGFAATHRLFEFKYSLIRRASETFKSLAEKGLHAFGDVILVEELVGVPGGGVD
jgi:hypothetical protein